MPAEKKKGQFTFRTAAVFFILSALVEIFSIFFGSRVPLFGVVHDGFVAAIYDLVYATLFAALGVGLWRGNRWGYTLVFVATIYYSLDTVQAFFSRDAAETDLKQQLIQMLAGHEDILQQAGVSKDDFINAILSTYHDMMAVLPLLFLACWWGFAWYTYVRRDYFQPGKS